MGRSYRRLFCEALQIARANARPVVAVTLALIEGFEKVCTYLF